MKDLNKNKRYSLINTTIKQRKDILKWLMENDKGWEFIYQNINKHRVIYCYDGEWFLGLGCARSTCATELFE